MGVLGWLTPDTSVLATGVQNINFTEIVPSVRSCLQSLKAAEPALDFVVGLSHSGVLDAAVVGPCQAVLQTACADGGEGLLVTAARR